MWNFKKRDEAALLDPSIDSEEFKGFIAAQAQRVREKGAGATFSHLGLYIN